MPDAMIVVDMQKAFMSPEGTLYCGDDARQIIPRIEARVWSVLSAHDYVFFTQDSHMQDDREFEMFPPHCISGSAEEKIVDELVPAAVSAHIVKKRRYSAFFETDLAERLATVHPEQVLVVGVCTNICVLHTVAELRNRDYAVNVPANCVASFDREQHQWALDHMEKILGAQISNR